MNIALNVAAAAALTAADYRALFERIVASGEPYGPPGGGYGADYTKLNLARDHSPTLRAYLRTLRYQSCLLRNDG